MKKYILWGAGKFVRNYIQLIRYMGDEISYIIDNSIKKQETYIEGTIVKGPSILLCTHEEIMISCLAIDEIRAYLVEKGLDKREVSISDYLDRFRKNEKYENNLFSQEHSARFFFDLFSGSEWGGAENWNYMVASSIFEKYPESNVSIISDNIVNIENYSNVNIKRFREDDDIEQIIRYIDSTEASIFVNSFFGKTFFALLALKIYAPQKVRIVTVVHNDFKDLYSLCDLFKNYIDMYICVSSKVADHLVNHLGINKDKVDFLYQPIDVKQYSLEDKNYDGIIRIGIASRLSKAQKRADYIPRIIDKLECLNVNYELFIAGDGECFDEIDKFVNKCNLSHKIKLLGKLSHDRMSDFWKSIDIYLNCSEFEGTSLAMLEAMCCGCVPVVTNVSGTNDYITDGENGFIKDIGDIDGLCNSIVYLDKNRNILKDMGIKSNRIILKNSDIRQYASRFHDLLCKIS